MHQKILGGNNTVNTDIFACIHIHFREIEKFEQFHSDCNSRLEPNWTLYIVFALIIFLWVYIYIYLRNVHYAKICLARKCVMFIELGWCYITSAWQ